jgi:hypothetical protein
MAGLMTFAAVRETQTWDEGLHLAAGFSYWKTGDYRLNTEHPPLQKLLAALPVIFTQAKMPDPPRAWRRADQSEFARAFLYQNTVHADTLLLLGRLTTIALTLGLVVLTATIARRRWGAFAGLIAAALTAADPNLIAHGHYVTSDVPVTLAIVGAVFLWQRYLAGGWPRHLTSASIALGIALATKFSALFLVPVHWFVCFLHRPSGPRRPLLAMMGAMLVVLLAYAPDSWRTLLGRKPPLAAHIGTASPADASAAAIATDLRLPAHPYLTGAWELFRHSRQGHRSYLLGTISEHGSIWYFPVAFAAKTPVAVLLLLLLIAVPVLLRALKRVPIPTWLIGVYPVVYLFICLSSSLNLGLRHLLPLYPFLYLWIAWAVTAALVSRWRRLAIAVLVTAGVVHSVEMARAHPHYTAFFNTIAGGPENGHRYLLDSNLDWGQDLKNVRRWMDQRGIKDFCYSYFGSAVPEYYGIAPWIPNGPEEPGCMAAVSATNLYDLYFQPPRHRWLRERTPAAVVGHSTWIFDLRGRDRVMP